MVLPAHLLAEIPDDRVDFPQVVARDVGEQVVLDLELQASMKPIHVPGARHVERGGKLGLEEGLGVVVHLHVGVRGHGKVRDGDLYMENPRHRVRDEKVRHHRSPRRHLAHEGREPDVEESETGTLHSSPLQNASAREIHDDYDRIEQKRLVSHHEVGKVIEVHDA
eukprot:CAMPEP_0167805008 /NCGR_PEP_ID=MMETSP0111_2-20121227/20885_1 /TAXON_ID=91324 /ORGANISM="Lotharella globosa, Strain CCCM811" /LENGTH=165 /DNA_ID=CAMNT_0007702005 /DNA_START=335 /DNA_END=830 /DNA_ORIENTATION=+